MWESKILGSNPGPVITSYGAWSKDSTLPGLGLFICKMGTARATPWAAVGTNGMVALKNTKFSAWEALNECQ